jgi:outer membrane receptor for monomeric catechols
MLSKQYEVGIKADVGGTLLTLAGFQIEKAFEYVDPSHHIYKQDGCQKNKGVKFGISGKIVLVAKIVDIGSRSDRNDPTVRKGSILQPPDGVGVAACRPQSPAAV